MGLLDTLAVNVKQRFCSAVFVTCRTGAIFSRLSIERRQARLASENVETSATGEGAVFSQARKSRAGSAGHDIILCYYCDFF